MPYIPKKHEKYDLLPLCRKRGGEVFEYPSDLISKAGELIAPAVNLIPCGYNSYNEYFNNIDELINKHKNNSDIVIILEQIKIKIKEMNLKEDWSVLKYIGPSDSAVLGLTQNKNYYWPTRKDHPVYCGVIDDVEFTTYLYPTESHLWEILEDPTGMAYNTIYGYGSGKMSTHEYRKIITEFIVMLNE